MTNAYHSLPPKKAFPPKKAWCLAMSKKKINQRRDSNWYRRHQELVDFLNTHGRVPSTTASDATELQLARWRHNQSGHIRRGWNVPMDKLELLAMTDEQAEKLKQGRKKLKQGRKKNKWTHILAAAAQRTEANGAAQLTILRQLIEQFPLAQGWDFPSQMRSVEEYLIKQLSATDIDPSNCTRTADRWTIEHALSYVVYPEFQDYIAQARPTSVHASGHSKYFDISALGDNVRECCKRVILSMPNWLVGIYRERHHHTEEALMQLTMTEERWFDHYKVSKRGTNHNGGSVLLTASAIGQPRRLQLSLESSAPRFDAKFKCTVAGLYGYSYYQLPRVWMGGRSLRDYPELLELGTAVWLRVRSHLGGVSSLIPPNGCNPLTYFDLFQARLHPHQDMAPNMSTDPQWSSQMVGSDVMVVKMFDPHLFEMTGMEHRGSRRRSNRPTWQVRTEHMSVYIMSAQDDINQYHRSGFVGLGRNDITRGSRVSVSLVYRWLGRQTLCFGSDYWNPERRNKEFHPNPERVVQEMFPASTQAQSNFKFRFGRARHV